MKHDDHRRYICPKKFIKILDKNIYFQIVSCCDLRAIPAGDRQDLLLEP